MELSFVFWEFVYFDFMELPLVLNILDEVDLFVETFTQFMVGFDSLLNFIF